MMNDLNEPVCPPFYCFVNARNSRRNIWWIQLGNEYKKGNFSYESSLQALCFLEFDLGTENKHSLQYL